MLQRVINKRAQVASLGVVASSLQRADLIGADRIRVRCLAHAIIVPAFHYAVKRQFMSLATDNYRFTHMFATGYPQLCDVLCIRVYP